MNPFMLLQPLERVEPTPPKPCIVCSAPVRRARILTEVTLFLDSKPTNRGSYYFTPGANGLVSEDRNGYTGDPTYRRHRCAGHIIDGWNGTDER